MTPTTVVVGTSVAGVRTAQTLRSAGYQGNVVLVGEETTLPYDKPPLSKELLAGTATAEEVRLLTEEGAAEADIQLELGRAATRLDVAARKLELADGTRLPFDDLVVATGARARPSPWGRPAGLYTLRTLDDAAALGARLRRGGPVAVIGAGFIGAEVAATARGAGVEDVTMIDVAPAPLGRLVPPSVGQRVARLHREHGVRLRTGVGVAAIDPAADGPVLRLDDGFDLVAATVVVGIGAVPNDEWLRESGLRVDDGVLCDAYGRAGPHVYAVGDVARWYHPRRGRTVRAEHWTSAVEQAGCVAHTITRPETPRRNDPIEYAWSDQYDWKIQIAGRTGADLTHVTVEREEPSRGLAVVCADAAGVLAGAVVVNWPRALVACRRALTQGATTLAEMCDALSARS